MNSTEIIAESKQNKVFPQREVSAYFDLDYLKVCMAAADDDFERNQTKRYIRSTVKNRRGKALPAFYWQTTLRIVMAVKTDDGWQQLVCRWH